MRTSISVDVGSFDLYLRDLAETVVEDSVEPEFLAELSDRLLRMSTQSGDDPEKRFCLEAAKKCSELAAWFTETAP